ncbi:MAG: gamma-glutamyltransferase, partial [Caenibius sp.]
AAGLVIAVVQSDVVNFAGVAPILIRMAETAQTHALAGLGAWPRAITPDYFMKHHGGAIPEGVLRTVVPAAPDAWITALSRFGTKTFGEVAEEAIRFARDGFVMYPLMSNIITAFANEYAQWSSNAAIYLPNGRPPLPGELFIQSDLAKTIQYMVDAEAAASGNRTDGLKAARDAFYKGDIAASILKFHREHGGLLSAEDLADWKTPVEQPVAAAFDGFEMHTPRPWCQGPSMIQMLRIVDALDLGTLEHNSVAYIHRLTEAFKAAFWERDRYFGDPDHVDVPLDKLLSREHAALTASRIDLNRARIAEGEHGRESVTLDTSYVCVVDRHGNVFSATPSDVSMETPVIPGTGICPSSRGSQSWADPSHPSSVGPGKRPRLTPSPAIAVFDDGRAMAIGTPGGDVQLQSMTQVFLNIHLFGMNPQEAVEAARFATYDFPDSFEPHARLVGRVNVESPIDDKTLLALRNMGHDATQWPERTWRAGSVCLIDYNPATGVRSAAADPRRQSYAIAC